MVAHRRRASEIPALHRGTVTRGRARGTPWRPASVSHVATEWQLDDDVNALPQIEAFFAGTALGAAVFGWTSGVVAGLGPAVVRLTATQVAFRHRIGFAWLWLPGAWLARPDAEVVLSLGLRQRLDSPRWKQVVEPYPGRWMHHLEVRDMAALDEQLAGWVAAAYAAAS